MSHTLREDLTDGRRNGGDRAEPVAIPASTGSVPSDLVRTLAARLQECHPNASPVMIQRSIDDAIAAFRDARVTVFLLILIERAASASFGAR